MILDIPTDLLRADADARHLVKDLVGVLVPLERFAVLVVGFDVSGDRRVGAAGILVCERA